MAKVSMELKTDDVQKALRQLKNRVPTAIVRALNRSIASANTVMVREVSKDLGMKQAEVRKEIRVREATVDRLVAQLSASLRRIPLYKFGARGPVPSRGRGKGVTVKGKRYPHAFIATVQHAKGSKVGVFQRKGVDRLPIRELHGASIGHVFDKYVPAAVTRGEEQLVKNLAHELRFALNQTSST